MLCNTPCGQTGLIKVLLSVKKGSGALLATQGLRPLPWHHVALVTSTKADLHLYGLMQCFHCVAALVTGYRYSQGNVSLERASI